MTSPTLPDLPRLPDLVDSHCHLDFPDLVEETAEIITRARAAGVNRMVTICTRLKNEPKVRAMAEAHPERTFLGIEWQADRVARTQRKLERLELHRTKVLQGEGLVQLGEGSDMRSRQVQLTAEGVARFERGAEAWQNAQAQVALRLGGEKREALWLLLDDLETLD